MRTKNTVDKQQKQIEARVRSIRLAIKTDPFGGLFNSDSLTEMAYLLGASHALKWTKNENVYEPSLFEVVKAKDSP